MQTKKGALRIKQRPKTGKKGKMSIQSAHKNAGIARIQKESAGFCLAEDPFAQYKDLVKD